MKLTQFAISILTAAAFALLSSPAAHAGTVHIKFDNPIFNGSGSDDVHINYKDALNAPASAYVSAGRFQGTASKVIGDDPGIFVDGLNDVYMYCYDLYEHVGSGWDVDYTINHSGPTARTLNFLGAVNYVLNGNSNTWTDNFAWAHPVNAYQGAAIQLGIWESKYDTDSNWSLLAGDSTLFSAYGQNALTTSWFTTFANAVKNPAVNDLPAILAMTLEASGAQDMITADPPTSVPEPLSLGLLAIGLAGLAAARRKV